MCLVSDSFCVIIVEGGVKAVRRYEKLMMRRIDWTAPLDDGAEEEEDPAAAANKCTCVWKGTTTMPTFRGKFRFETVRSEAAARKYLADMNLAHFYDAAAAAIAVDGPVEDEERGAGRRTGGASARVANDALERANQPREDFQ